LISIPIVGAILGVVCLILGIWGFYMDTSEKRKALQKDRIDRAVDDAARKVLGSHGIPKNNFVKIGSMPAPFNPQMHDCNIGDPNAKGLSVGDVVACAHPDCGKEYILGWWLSSNPLNNIPGVKESKRWVAMSRYESNPGEYVYSK
jgi:hypothetical protein